MNRSLTPTLPGQVPTLRPLIVGCLAATWLIWGSTYLAIKFALLSFPPFFQMGSRFVVAGMVLTFWARWRGQPWPTARQWQHATVVGGLMLGAGMGCTAWAEESVGSGLVVAFIAVIPMMMALVNLCFGLRPHRSEWAGMVLGLAGVLLLSRGAGFQAAPVGLLAIVVACAGWSLGSVLTQQRLPLAPGAMGYASEMLCGGVLLLALAWGSGEAPQWPPQPVALAAWVYLVVMGSLVAFNAYMLLLAEAPVGLASSYSFVNPVIAMLLGVWLGHEQVSPYEWSAAGVVLGGVMLLLRGRY